MSEPNQVKGTSRREALKLAGAIAAFGVSLGFWSSASGQRIESKVESKILEYKIIEYKWYRGGTLVHSIALPSSISESLSRGERVTMKVYQSGVEDSRILSLMK
jgi:hypothetical protein